MIQRRFNDMEEAHANETVDPAREAEVDIAFHSSIVDASHNSMLIHMMASIYELMKRSVFYNREYLIDREHSIGFNDTRDQLLEQHRAIAAGILEGNPEVAAEKASAHLDFVETRFRDGDNVSRRASLARKRLMVAESNGGFGIRRARKS